MLISVLTGFAAGAVHVARSGPARGHGPAVGAQATASGSQGGAAVLAPPIPAAALRVGGGGRALALIMGLAGNDCCGGLITKRLLPHPTDNQSEPGQIACCLCWRTHYHLAHRGHSLQLAKVSSPNGSQAAGDDEEPQHPQVAPLSSHSLGTGGFFGRLRGHRGAGSAPWSPPPLGTNDGSQSEQRASASGRLSAGHQPQTEVSAQLAVTQASARPLLVQNMVWIDSTAFISSSALA